MAQVTVADIATIAAVPLLLDPSRAGRTALGGLVVCVAAVGLAWLTIMLGRTAWMARMREQSVKRDLGLELRLSLLALFTLAWLADRGRHERARRGVRGRLDRRRARRTAPPHRATGGRRERLSRTAVLCCPRCPARSTGSGSQTVDDRPRRRIGRGHGARPHRRCGQHSSTGRGRSRRVCATRRAGCGRRDRLAEGHPHARPSLGDHARRCRHAGVGLHRRGRVERAGQRSINTACFSSAAAISSS